VEMSAKPYSEACDQNKEPILAVLTQVLPDSGELLEIGSGTGQHAAYFPRHLPALMWQPSDVAQHLPGIRAWCEEAGLANVRAPVELEVCQPDWPARQVDAVFSANTAHIMSWPQVQCMFAGVGRVLASGGCFCLYGPFKYEGRHTSASNERFDAWLHARDPLSGVRDFEALSQLAADAGMTLIEDYAMPVNNRTLVWRRG
jgi:SAM-dependent methyltransferase